MLFFGVEIAVGGVLRPRFSWDTLQSFVHTSNVTGPFNDAAVAALARYPMATFEKYHNSSKGFLQESNVPPTCKQVSEASGGNTLSFYYLNAVIDWSVYILHEQMEANPSWRLKNTTGGDVFVVAGWVFNHSVQAVREAWVVDCVNAVKAVS